MTTSTKFWDKIADKYSKQPIADEASYQKKLKVTQNYFKPDMSILEFGCGTGSTAIIHAPFVKHLRVIDISSAMIKIAQDKAKAQDINNITFEQLTAVGVMIQISPVDFYAGNNIDIGGNVNLLSEIRASSGALLAYGLLIFTGVFVSQLTFTSMLLSSLLFLSYGLSRFASMVLDGMPVNSLIEAGIVEVLVGLFCLFCLWKYRDELSSNTSE